MLSTWLVYFWVVLDSIDTLLSSVVFLSVVGSAITVACFFIGQAYWYGEQDRPSVQRDKVAVQKIGKWKTLFIPLVFISLLLNVFLPNTKQIAVIYLLPKIANNEALQGVAGDGLSLMKKQMQKWMKDLDESNPDSDSPAPDSGK